MTERPEPMLWLSDARGIFIPRDFALSFAHRGRDVTGVDDADWAVLEAGPDHADYWDVWADVSMDAVVAHEGRRWRVWHDGDCWLVPEGMEWDDDAEHWRWPAQEERP